MASRNEETPWTPAFTEGLDRHGRRFRSTGGKRNWGACFGALFLVDGDPSLRVNACGFFRDAIAEGGIWFSCGHRNRRRLPHGEPNRLFDRSKAVGSRFEGRISYRYRMTAMRRARGLW